MAFVLPEKSRKVLTYLQDNPHADATQKVIAAATGLNPKSVLGILVSLTKRGLVERIDVEGVEGKVARVTPAGATFDVLMEKAEE